MFLHREHMMAVLSIAISERERVEKEQGYTGDSAALATWRKALEATKSGEHIQVL